MTICVTTPKSTQQGLEFSFGCPYQRTHRQHGGTSTLAHTGRFREAVDTCCGASARGAGT